MKFLLIVFVVGGLIELNSCGPAQNKKDEYENNSSAITDEEREFVREIEEKFNIKNEKDVVQPKLDLKQQPQQLPAIIAIEIVNDNATDSKGKRTIDANLGYGYKTNTGYYYTHFNRPQEKGKFMIYPYSQEDIPPNPNPGKTYKYHTQIVYHNKAKGEKTHVEIQPSKAYELIPIDSNDGHHDSYQLGGGVSHIDNKYEHVQAVQPPPPYQYQKDVTTLYSTLNGGQLSGLSGQFPLVMPNYYVSPSQFLNHYPGLELPNQQKPIIPVIILRIPSSQIHNPTAELFPKVPPHSPLNNINLQAIVDQYLDSIRPQYEEPVYQQQPYYYTMPNVVYQQYNHEQPIQYVVPSPAPYYGTPKPHPVYEDENLPFSENYPDNHHTQVVYAPQHQQHQQQYVGTHNQISVYDDEAEAENADHGSEENASPTPQPYNYHAHPFPKRQIKQSDEPKMNSRKLRSGAQETST